MRTPSLLSRESVGGPSSLHAFPSVEQCVPPDQDRGQFLSKSSDGLSLNQARIAQPFSFVCRPWLRHPSKRATMTRTRYPRPKIRTVGIFAILPEDANIQLGLGFPKRWP